MGASRTFLNHTGTNDSLTSSVHEYHSESNHGIRKGKQ